MMRNGTLQKKRHPLANVVEPPPPWLLRDLPPVGYEDDPTSRAIVTLMSLHSKRLEFELQASQLQAMDEADKKILLNCIKATLGIKPLRRRKIR